MRKKKAPRTNECRIILICDKKYSHQGKKYGPISSSSSLPLPRQPPPRKTATNGQRWMVCPTSDACRDGIYFRWDVPQYQRLCTCGLPPTRGSPRDSWRRRPDCDRCRHVLEDGGRICSPGPTRGLLSTARTTLHAPTATRILPASAAQLSTAAALLSAAPGPAVPAPSAASQPTAILDRPSNAKSYKRGGLFSLVRKGP